MISTSALRISNERPKIFAEEHVFRQIKYLPQKNSLEVSQFLTFKIINEFLFLKDLLENWN